MKRSQRVLISGAAKEERVRNPSGKAQIEDRDDVPAIRSFSDGDLQYRKLIGPHPVGEISCAEGLLTRRLSTIRSRDVSRIPDNRITKIHHASGCTIGIFTNTSTRYFSHALLELVGTIHEIEVAEGLIRDAIVQTYSPACVPTPIMPVQVCHKAIVVPKNKIIDIFGIDGKNLLRMEVESGTWIRVRPENWFLDWQACDRVITVHGSEQSINNVLEMIKKIILRKKMDQTQKIDKYAKARIEEPNQRLPKSLLKPISDLCYKRIFEEDNRKAQHLADAISAGAQLGRKVYRICNKELIKVLEMNFAGMIHIHRVSKATIGLLADTETNKHSQAYLDLVGTVGQVNMAEEMILDKVLKTYSSVCHPVILMPPTIFHYEVKIHENKVLRVLGFERTHIVRMEMTSGAWIRVNPNPPRGRNQWERVVSVYGPRVNVIRAVSLIHETISEPMNSFDAGNDFKEPTCAELIGGKNPAERNPGERSEPQESKEAERNVVKLIFGKMDQNRKINKFTKARIEEPNQLLKPGSDPTSDLCYQKIFEEDNRKAQHLAEAIAAGAQLGRKVYRIRNKELIKVLEMNFVGMIHIQRVSKATIGLLADTETNKHSQAYLDLAGTVEQVNMAEEMILDKVLKTYSSVCYPVILMPPTVYGYEMQIHENKVLRVLGFERAHIVRMEMTSGAWITVDPNPTRGGNQWERAVNVYGPRENVIKAVSLIHQTISEPMESFDAGNDFKEPTCAELIGEGSVPKEWFWANW